MTTLKQLAEAVAFDLKHLRESGPEGYDELREDTGKLVEAALAHECGTAELVAALQRIAEHPHCVYPAHLTRNDRSYEIGVSDGHRCAAEIARAVLAKHGRQQ